LGAIPVTVSTQGEVLEPLIDIVGAVPLRELSAATVRSALTPQEIAEVRPRLAAFTVEMFGDLPRKDQRAKGELFARR
jgi:hypothetical protein